MLASLRNIFSMRSDKPLWRSRVVRTARSVPLCRITLQGTEGSRGMFNSYVFINYPWHLRCLLMDAIIQELRVVTHDGIALLSD